MERRPRRWPGSSLLARLVDAGRGGARGHGACTTSTASRSGLFPPVPIDSQSCAAADALPDGTHVRRRGMDRHILTHSAYAMARLAAVWGDDCAEYRPERWLGVDGAFYRTSPFRFTVFHGGPRMCLGKEMAYVEMKSIVASVREGGRRGTGALRGAQNEGWLAGASTGYGDEWCLELQVPNQFHISMSLWVKTKVRIIVLLIFFYTSISVMRNSTKKTELLKKVSNQNSSNVLVYN